MTRARRAPAWAALVLFCSASAQAAPPDRYEKIHELFLRGDYVAAERDAAAYLDDPRAAKSDDVLYLQALSLVKLGRGSEAREKLRRLERSARAGEQRAAAAVSTADSYYQEGIYNSAYESYKYVLEKFPAAEESAYVRERLAGSAARMNPLDGRQARTSLGQRSIEESSKPKQ